MVQSIKTKTERFCLRCRCAFPASFFGAKCRWVENAKRSCLGGVLLSVSVGVQESVGVGAQESVVGVENLLLLGPRRHQTGGECAP